MQKSFTWDDDIVSTVADINEAKKIFNDQLAKFRAASDEDADIALCFSCPTRRYFRHDIWPAYKGNRKGASPLALKALREWASEEWPTWTKPNLEADDVLGILGTHKTLIPGEKIIISHDKDLLQIPGLHLAPRDVFSGVFRVAPAFAKRQLAEQTLIGDVTDNYPGCPGVGKVKAKAILDAVPDGESFIPAILAAFEKAKLTADDMAIQVNTARILHSHHYDFKRKTPILW